VNITPAERLGRVGIGLAAGAVLLATAGPVLAVVLEVLLVLVGLDLAVTGALGHCPLYQKLGYRAASRCWSSPSCWSPPESPTPVSCSWPSPAPR